MLSIIVAIANNWAIGSNNNLLCYLPDDLKRFKSLTLNHTIVMGRRTFESLPKGALPNRRNVVLTSQCEDRYNGCEVVRSLDEVLQLAQSTKDEVFVIGGAMLYRALLPYVDNLYITNIDHTFDCVDTLFPEVDFSQWNITYSQEHEIDERHPYRFTYINYTRKG